ncbi:MAG TPA: hypothetical protein VK184_10760 [Nostocaceae cyanobacterium]|nr:hypothetical protein [Nostocaceae cyanobacterium]
MPNIKLEDLDTSPISFELSTEDINSIKGGTKLPGLPPNFPLEYFPGKSPRWSVIIISPPPPTDPETI